jgi:hypothetical protein
MDRSQTTTKKIWYASYGSNLSFQRFKCYIEGGTPPGSTNTNPGCRDKTLPSDRAPVSLNFELYFAGNSTAWRGAPAFLRNGGSSARALGRMYLITDDQFNDVVMQENGQEVNGARFVPSFEELTRKNEFDLPGDRLYGHLLRVGLQGGWPVITFTTARVQTIAAPSKAYIKVIVAGIRETYPAMTNVQICEYLLRAEGVHGRISPEELADWVSEKL